jgi:hypothetical protein
VPFVVIVALVLVALGSANHRSGAGTSSAPGALPAITATAPPHAGAQTTPCSKVLAQLPVSLGKLAPRVVHTTPTDTPYVVAWGDPPVLLSCGVARPKALVPGSSETFISGGELEGPYFDVQRKGDANVYTTVDREPYIALTIPATYPAANYLPLLSRAIAQAVPAVCSTDSGTPDPDKLCTRRKD